MDQREICLELSLSTHRIGIALAGAWALLYRMVSSMLSHILFLLAKFRITFVLVQRKKTAIFILPTDAHCCFSTVVAVVLSMPIWTLLVLSPHASLVKENCDTCGLLFCKFALYTSLRSMRSV